MATTKIRPKTPMLNKPAAWRKNAIRGYGRKLRNIMMQFKERKPMMLPIHKFLFTSAGIATPKYDVAVLASKTPEPTQKDDIVSDIEFKEVTT